VYTHSITVCFADLLREGDELLEIDGVPVTGKSADEIIALMVWV
jgi:cystathionine beta-lyase family protein involved in aluminum resistance